MNTPINNLIDLVKDFVKQSFHDEITSIHLDRTGYWCKQLYPDSSETLILAAISHDIERSVVTEEEKFEWMYRRISRTLPIANELVEPLYKQAIVKARNLSRS